MKKKTIFKTLAIVAMFSVSYLGFSFSNESGLIAGESFNVTMVSLSSQAKADCEPVNPLPVPGLGECNGWGRCSLLYTDWGYCVP